MRRFPAVARFGVPLAPQHALIRAHVERARCPEPLREQLGPLLLAQPTTANPSALATCVRALWCPDWRSAACGAISAAIQLGARDAAARLVEVVRGERVLRYATPALAAIVTTGLVEGRFVGDLRARRTEDEFTPSLALLVALVDTICTHGDVARSADAERLVTRLRPREQPYARAHLARLAQRFGRSWSAVRATSLRAGAELLRAREAIAMDQLDEARAVVERIAPAMLRAWGRLEIARGLVARGRFVEALRLAQRVECPELAAARQLVRAEVQLCVRTDRERYHGIDAADRWELPAWLRPITWISSDCARTMITCAGVWRLGMREGNTGLHFRGGEVTSPQFLALCARIGIDLDAALARTPDCDPMRAAHVAMRAATLAASSRDLPDAMVRGLAGARTFDHADARSLERALFDEGVALSPTAPQRRRVLIGVAQTCLRSALAHPAAWPRDVVRARLRTLGHLGGALATDALAKPLTELPIDGAAWPAALAMLCALDAERARELVLARYGVLEQRGLARDALERIIGAGGISRELARAYTATFHAVAAQLGDDAAAWIAEARRVWRARTGAWPDDAALAWLRTRDARVGVPALFAELDAALERATRGDTDEMLAHLIADPRALATLVLGTPALVDPRMQRWDAARWRALLAGAAKAPDIDAAVVLRCASLLRARGAAYALSRGDLVQLGAIPLTEVATANDARFRVRLLDKRRDLLAYLRFADVPARSCYRSTSDAYDWSAALVVAAWRDPLWMCLRIERESGAPCGFLVGSFAVADGRLALVFNSLHVRPNSPELRALVLGAVERSVCAPLGIGQIALANVHGGRGVLPEDYIARDETIERFRALRDPRTQAPVTWIDDDVEDANTPVLISGLHWKQLPATV